MLCKYKNEEEIHQLLSLFETAAIAREKWKHAEHLIVALCYLEKHDIDTATDKMRSGIFNLLAAFGVDLTKEMPYHETLTVFWMRTIADFNTTKNNTPLLDRANELVSVYDKDYALKFYSREFLFSDLARSTFVEADLAKTAI